jgi:hypothetical protein
MLLNIRNKNVYSLGVGISMVFKIVSYFNFPGGWGLTMGVDPGVMTHISSDAP